MDTTYRQLAKISIVFLIFFLLSGWINSAFAKAGLEKKIAVFIETEKNDRSMLRSHFDYALSIKKMLEFKLFNKKVGAEIYLIPKNSTHEYIRSIQRSDYYGLVVVNFSVSDKKDIGSFQRRVYKKHHPEISLQFSMTYSEIDNSRIEKLNQKNFEVHSRLNWFEPTEEETDIIKQISEKPEPVSFLIQRAIDSLTIDIPLRKMIFTKPDNLISVALFIDSSFIDLANKNWLNKYDNMMQFSSNVLDRQFAYGLDVKSLVTADIKKDRTISMHRLFRNLKQNKENLRERLVVYLINNNDREDYFLSNQYDNIGLAEIGRSQILINEIPAPTVHQTEWQAMYNSLTLLHEIGHTFGAVHVSDKYSIMNHNLTWLTANDFDPLNRQIVKDAMQGKIVFVKKEDYLGYVTDLILASDYYLVDIPSFYYNFFKRKSDSLLFQSFSKSERYKPFLYAASGYGYMEGRQYKHAELEFIKALEYLPTQASFYYYLSLCTEGDVSRSYLEKAFKLGYYLAEIEYD